MTYAHVPSPFGPLTVFERDGALVALEWGRGSGEAGEPTPLLRDALDQLDAYFDGRLRRFTLPLNPTGTRFQRRVWQRMGDIPYGQTASYGALALDLDTGPRAVAAVCAANPLTILIPCHRVIAARRRLGGYSSGEGVATKLALLRLEGADLPRVPAAVVVAPMPADPIGASS